jgi:radical SAM PhpK family P-methyltransferase
MRDHVRIDGEPAPYMDVINYFINQRGDLGNDNYYHVAEIPNLAAVYLSSYLARRGFGCEFVSLFGPERDRVADILERRSPRVVAITTTFYLAPWPLQEISSFIRERASGTVIVAGGPLVNNLVDDLGPEALQQIFRWSGADIYVREAQGEQTLERLVRAARSGSGDITAPNCFIRDGSRYRFTGSEPEANPMDECVIDWDLFPAAQLGPSVQTRTARSCAFKCSFCDFPVRAGALSLASIEAVESEMRQIARRGIKNLVFIDDTFNVPVKRFKEICRMMIRNDFQLSWYSYFRCSAVHDRETFDLMKESGCKGVFLGVESGDEDVLQNMTKVATLDRYRSGIDELKSRDIVTFASFIAGFPGETQETIENTLQFINETQPMFYRMEPWWYNHRSPIRQQADKYAITGQGYKWKHSTMSAEGACEAIDHIFSNVTGSVWMPLYNFDFWSLPYLHGKGFANHEIAGVLAGCHELMALNDSDPADEATRNVARRATDKIRNLMMSVQPAPARYRIPAGVSAP